MKCINKMIWIAGLVAFCMACGGEDPSGENTNDENQNQIEPDAGNGDANDDSGEEDTGNDGEECTPIETCEVDQCGTIDDGCEGTIDCGACECEDGVAASETCGSCDLGRVVCEEGHTGSATCEEPDIPGLGDGCDDLVYVSQGTGTSTGLGTKEDPVNRLDDAVSVAKSSGAVAVIVAGGSSVEYEGPIKIDQRLSIIAGFTEDWVRDEEYVPLVRSDASAPGLADEDVVGLSSVGIGQHHVISNFDIETDDVQLAGGTNYGVHVSSSPGLRIRNIKAVAGRGGDGVDGSSGDSGAAGEPGEDAPETIGFSGWQNQEAGEGGVNTDCPDSYGGDGGLGENGQSSGDDAEAGDDATDAAGGAGGDNSTDVNEVGGEDGEDGPVLTSSGDNGVGGSSIGEVSNGRWAPLGDGEHGVDGADGSGGGGGGGGGINPDWDSGNMQVGSYGGGGGAGGCGGEGGEPGTGGGGSFGLFLVDANIDIESSSFFADLGGEGGEGGIGGGGGAGAPGGESAVSHAGASIRDYESEERGGFGGHGADGEDAGHGGGGAGGVSYGAYCQNAEITTSGTVRFSAGGVSQGGNSAGISGENGVSEDEHQCN